MLGEEELLKSPYSIENPAHRRVILAELERVKALGVKPPQNLWEYKVTTLLRQNGWCSVLLTSLQVAHCVLLVKQHICISTVKEPSLYCFCQAANAGKSLFLLYALKRSPRLTIFYLYLFDYSETFLPFLHTCCPAVTDSDQPVESSFVSSQVQTRQTSHWNDTWIINCNIL